jgi:hypothetical protein
VARSRAGGSYELIIIIIRSSQVPADVALGTGRDADGSAAGAGRLSCLPDSRRRTGFPRCPRSAHSSTSESPRHKGCETTSLPELQGGRKVPQREQRRSSQPQRLEGANCSASNRLHAYLIADVWG